LITSKFTKTLTKVTTPLLCAFLISCGGGGDGSDAQGGDLVLEEPRVNDTPYENVCTTDELPEYTGESEFTLGTITASYYSEVDDFVIAQGTNGTDPDIVPEFVFQESVDKVWMSYAYSSFHGIDANQIYAVWEGTIEVTSDTGNILASIATGRSDVALYVDGELVKRLKDCSRDVPLELANLSFTDKVVHSFEEVRIALSENSTNEEEVVYVYATSSTNVDGKITVSVPESDKDLVVILNSEDPVSWEILNPHNSTIKAVVYTSNQRASTLDYAGTKYMLIGMINDPVPAGVIVREMTGKNIKYAAETSNVSEIIITSSDLPSVELQLGEQVVLVNNLQALSLETPVADSIVNGQIIATYMPLIFDTRITKVKWSTWSNIVIESCGSFCERRIPQDFNLVIYSGDTYPQHFVYTEAVTVSPEHQYSTEGGNIYNAETELVNTIDLDAGNYWISMQYILKEEGVFYKSVLEADGNNLGGAFSLDGGVNWNSTSAGLSPTQSIGTSIFIEGYIDQR